MTVLFKLGRFHQITFFLLLSLLSSLAYKTYPGIIVMISIYMLMISFVQNGRKENNYEQP